MQTIKSCRLLILLLLALNTAGCYTTELWRAANDTSLQYSGVDSATVAAGGKRALRILYAHDPYGSVWSPPVVRQMTPALACVVIPLKADGTPEAPFTCPNTILGDDAPIQSRVDTQTILSAAGQAHLIDPRSVHGLPYGFEMWESGGDEPLHLIAYRIKPNSEVETLQQPEPAFSREHPTTLPAGYHLLVVPYRRKRGGLEIFEARAVATIATPFTVAVDTAMISTSPIWFTVICLTYTH